MDEIETIVNVAVRTHGLTEQRSRNWLRRRLRALARKAFWTNGEGSEKGEYNPEEAFKERFGIKP